MHGLIRGNGIRILIQTAAGQNIDGGGGHAETGIVPCKGDIVTDLVVLSAGDGGGGDHLDSSRG